MLKEEESPIFPIVCIDEVIMERLSLSGLQLLMYSLSEFLKFSKGILSLEILFNTAIFTVSSEKSLYIFKKLSDKSFFSFSERWKFHY